jgi:hypothetical protein
MAFLLPLIEAAPSAFSAMGDRAASEYYLNAAHMVNGKNKYFNIMNKNDFVCQ